MLRLRDRGAAREFERFVAGSLGGLYRTAYLMTCDAGATEDLCQDTLIKVARRWRRVRAMANPEAYTRRVLVNLVIDTAPRRRRSQEELSVDAHDQRDGVADESIAITLQRVHDTDELMRALTTLTDPQRQVLVLRYLADWSVEEVARRAVNGSNAIEEVHISGGGMPSSTQWISPDGHSVRIETLAADGTPLTTRAPPTPAPAKRRSSSTTARAPGGQARSPRGRRCRRLRPHR